MLNPCSEIQLGIEYPVVPWAQVQLMLQLKMIELEDAQEALRILEDKELGPLGESGVPATLSR